MGQKSIVKDVSDTVAAGVVPALSADATTRKIDFLKNFN